MPDSAPGSPLTSGRAYCTICLRPQRTCLCRWIATVDTDIEVVILQHPLEVGNAKGSAHLLHLSLKGSRMVVGETFQPAELQTLLYSDSAAQNRQPLLLYPETPEAKSLGLSSPPMIDAIPADPARLRLIVIDGTWRKSRKILYQNPLLQQLPRLSLPDTTRSRYHIRKAHKPDQVSTLEATCYALMQLDVSPGKFTALLSAFDGFIDQHLALVKAFK